MVWKVEEIVTGERYRAYGHVSEWTEPTPVLSKHVNIEMQRTINLHVILNWFDT